MEKKMALFRKKKKSSINSAAGQVATKEDLRFKDDAVYLYDDEMTRLEENDDPRITIKVLSARYDAKEALMLLLHTDPSLDIQEIEEFYYPYVRFRYLIRVGKKTKRFDKLNKILDCSVDRVSGTPYEAYGIPEYEETEVYREDMLDIQVPLVECYDIAHDFAMKLYISKGKLMMTPDFQIIEEEEFFKRFFVVNCLDPTGLPYDILVDAVDGGMTILDSELHLDLIEKSKNLLGGDDNILEDGEVIEGEVLEGEALEDIEILEDLESIEIIGEEDRVEEESEVEEEVTFIDIEEYETKE